ncbi:Nme8 [Acrasis kona]|uniref:Nme8 n=1 Tax=Acrasis kona TaxID=1008807 RepID=A0AAW2Z9V0_9EUKA
MSKINVYSKYQDDDTRKDVTLYVDTLQEDERHKHVFIGWENGIVEDRIAVQQVHLTMDAVKGGKFVYIYFPQFVDRITKKSIGFKSKKVLKEKMTREERDYIIEVARGSSMIQMESR